MIDPTGRFALGIGCLRLWTKMDKNVAIVVTTCRYLDWPNLLDEEAA